jgi:hypothetical protein
MTKDTYGRAATAERPGAAGRTTAHNLIVGNIHGCEGTAQQSNMALL